MQIRRNGAWAPLSTGKAYVNGAWRTLVNGKGYISGSWRSIVSFVQTLTLSIGGPLITKSTSATMTSGSITATPTGGLGPFSYAWTVTGSTNLSGTSLSGGTTASIIIAATVVPGIPGDSGTLGLQCVATDSFGSTATAQATATFVIPSSGGF